MTLLEVIETVSIKEHFLEYGILGLIAFVLGYFAWMQYQRLIKKNDNLEMKVDRLQEEMMGMLIEERERMSELIRANTEALKDLQQTIFKYLVKNSD